MFVSAWARVTTHSGGLLGVVVVITCIRLSSKQTELVVGSRCSDNIQFTFEQVSIGSGEPCPRAMNPWTVGRVEHCHQEGL